MRIISGYWKGRHLTTAPGLETRPTSDRVKEAIFSILGNLRGRKVIDLFAGSGALGIEALSRGASQAVFVDASESAVRALTANLSGLNPKPATRVLTGDVKNALGRLSADGPFDLVFIDPPYKVAHEAALWLSSAPRALFSETCELVFEHARADVVAPSGFHLESTRKYGETAVSFFTRAASDDVNDSSPASPSRS